MTDRILTLLQNRQHPEMREFATIGGWVAYLPLAEAADAALVTCALAIGRGPYAHACSALSAQPVEDVLGDPAFECVLSYAGGWPATKHMVLGEPVHYNRISMTRHEWLARCSAPTWATHRRTLVVLNTSLDKAFTIVPTDGRVSRYASDVSREVSKRLGM